MSYLSVYQMLQSPSLLGRIKVCANMQGKTVSGLANTSDQWVLNNQMTILASSGWDTAWASSTSEDPGADPNAITDAMILSAIQAIP